MSIFGSRTKALEILYLFKGLKPVVRQGFYENELASVVDFCNKNSLAIEISPYKVLLDDSAHYSNKGLKVSKDDPRRGMYFVYISKNANKAIMADAYEIKNDHRSLGMLLGYPQCCVDFYSRNRASMATTDNDFLRATIKDSKEYRYPYFNNISKRSMDLTLLNHFPCSFRCEASMEIAKNNFAFLKQYVPKTAEQFRTLLKGRVLVHDKFFEFY